MLFSNFIRWLSTVITRRRVAVVFMTAWFAFALLIVAASTSYAAAYRYPADQLADIQPIKNTIVTQLGTTDPSPEERACIKEQVERTKDSSTKNVLDVVDLLSDEERNALQKQADGYAKKLKMSVSLLYTDEFCGLEPMVFADEFYEEADLGLGEEHSGVLMAIDVKQRELWLTTEGEGINQLNDSEITSINNDVKEDLGNDDWSAGAHTYFDDIEIYCGEKKPMNPYLLYGISGLVGVTAGGVVGRSRAKTNAAKHETVIPSADALFYADMSTLDIVYANETFTHSIQEVNPHAEKTTTHRSSSGRVHGGGGTSF